MSISERIDRNITITIDGKLCHGSSDQTILQIARANDIYIPTMCYLTKVLPIASCRMCVVEVEGVDGMILSCQERAVDGIVVRTNSDDLYKERQNIMKLYDVNHPLECGVCDKSGECDLQNKTLEFGIDQQSFAAKDQHRPVQNWGFVSYDPALCIMCEKCVRVSTEITGNEALKIKTGGYRSTIVNTKMDHLDMSLGESAAVCPVGALVVSDFKYTTNAWELDKIPATCSHCSGGCQIYYEVKNDKIYRVINEYEYGSICGRSRFDFNFANTGVKKDVATFKKAIEAFKDADSVIFDSKITNEEAFILQKLKEKLGFKLINHEARAYQRFLNSYASISGKSLYSGTLSSLSNAKAVIIIGTKIDDDNEQVKYHTTMASKRHKARVIYMHPIEDLNIQNIVTQFIKYEIGTEEGVAALLADTLLDGVDIPKNFRAVLDDLDIGNLSAESNVGEEELEEISKALFRKKERVLVVGADLYMHERAENIAKLLALLERYADFELIIVPPSTNTLGVSLICDLDDMVDGRTVGYNAAADFVLSCHGDGDLDMPALNQQEGTFTTLDKKVVPTNVAVEYGGYVLNDIANEFGLPARYTIEYTAKLPKSSGYKAQEFDTLPDFFDKLGNEYRGYILENIECQTEESIDKIDELDTYDGAVIYNCDSKKSLASTLLASDSNKYRKYTKIFGSAQFAQVTKLMDGDVIKFTVDGVEFVKVFHIDPSLRGIIALNPTFDLKIKKAQLCSYRFNILKFQILKGLNE